MVEQIKKAAPNHQVHWSFWCGLAFFILVIIGMLTTAWMLNNRLQQDETAPVTQLVIDGETPYTKKADVIKAVEQINLGNFFKVDVNQVQKVLAELPWVYSAAVRKQWPNTLKIYLVDQKPVAIWNGDFLLNEQGQIFQADLTRLTSPLPQFFGPGGSEQTILKNFKNLNGLLALEKLSIKEMVLSERYAWQLTLNNEISINLGQENRFSRIQRFLDVYQEINSKKLENQQIDYVDLRYDTGLAVAWKKITKKERV
jgi:cell division protein FtsQ